VGPSISSGGTLALSSSIDATLTLSNYNPVRVAGVNLFATAVAIADLLGTDHDLRGNGLGFADALSTVSAAAGQIRLPSRCSGPTSTAHRPKWRAPSSPTPRAMARRPA
jgi:hypothetical protein